MRPCRECQQQFEPKFSGQLYCQPQYAYNDRIMCAKRAAARARNRKPAKDCLRCGKTFELLLHHEGQKYCSATCRKKSNGQLVDKLSRNCKQCGTPITFGQGTNHNTQFCRRSCWEANHRARMRNHQVKARHRAKGWPAACTECGVGIICAGQCYRCATGNEPTMARAVWLGAKIKK